MHTKRKVTEDILNDLTFEEGYTDSEGSECNQIQTSDSLQHLLDYFDEVQELGDGSCLFRMLARGAFDDNERYDELRDAIWDFILVRRNTFLFCRKRRCWSLYSKYETRWRVWGRNWNKSILHDVTDKCLNIRPRILIRHSSLVWEC